jgi:uncharacterized oligopeptide transporter (OPT) family protein
MPARNSLEGCSAPPRPLRDLALLPMDYDGVMTDEESTTVSPARLRLGVSLIIVWWIPFWALSPYIADSLSSTANPPSVAAITTVIVIVQTIIGLLGFLVAGKEVKSIVNGVPKKQALASVWFILVHGTVRPQAS